MLSGHATLASWRWPYVACAREYICYYFIYVFVVIFLCNSYSLAVWRFSLVQVVFRYYMLAYTAWSLQCQKSPIYLGIASQLGVFPEHLL